MIHKSVKIQGAVSAPYSIEIRRDLSELSAMLSGLGLPAKRACVVTESRVGPLYAPEVRRAAEASGFETTVFTFEAGEEHKDLSQISALYKHLIERSFDRRDVLIALGGGVCGDMCGFAAATYLRGIDFIQVPTTLLSMVDSSVGGKTGVDLDGYKNMVGAFHQPRLVYMGVETLNTLPAEQFASGMAEVIKHGLIRNADYLDMLERDADAVRALSPETLADLIEESVRIKAEIVEHDPTERNERRLLNFGHTVGHAVEKASGLSFTHGQCVALGSIAAGRISVSRGTLTEADLSRMKRIFASYGLRTEIPSIDRNAVTEAMMHDKKKQGDAVAFVLLDGPGRSYVCGDVTKEQIGEGLEEIICRK